MKEENIGYRKPEEGKPFNKNYFTSLAQAEFERDLEKAEIRYSESSAPHQDATNIIYSIMSYHCECVPTIDNPRYEEKTRENLTKSICRFIYSCNRGTEGYSREMLISAIKATRSTLEEQGFPYSTTWAEDLRKFYKNEQNFQLGPVNRISIVNGTDNSLPMVEAEIVE